MRANPDQWRRVRTLRLAALADTPDAFGSTFDEEAKKPEIWWQGRLENHARGTTLVARLDDEDVGLIVLGATWDDPPDGGVYSVWVAPSARGRGVGDALMHAVIQLGRDRGFHRLILDVGDQNTAAVALYTRHGFEATGRTGTLPPPREHVLEHERALVLRP